MSNINEILGTDHKYKFYDSKETTKKSNDLDKDAFLKLLITQMQNQDPLNPMDDREFISQMAQFTSLEQMQNMNEGIVGLSEHMTMMNNNIVKSQTFISETLDSMNTTLLKLAKHLQPGDGVKEEQQENAAEVATEEE